MSELFASGRIIDLIVGLLLAEGAGLVLYHRRTGRGIPPRQLVGFLSSGVFLMLALRAALTNVHWLWIWLALLGALISHLADLALRWPRD
ncbi:DUF3995 domain-containing protein [Caldichromatium japonicum]|uniref:DUF3995 domain-containing protein n=1 Tax=Caldichromatium japonicum TaxID=2699430 RepID=A0A6G7VFE2_9GAMM|nr:DUF3995 domain-containing protein [Caldichromatium japonicum]QIK38803.1 DUF3995 domain-containing protein [Caldichromatium japonicum]